MIFILFTLKNRTIFVGFVQTTYIAMEGVGLVEVCVELTSPVGDILDETVTVSVTSYSASTYIPTGATLASMELQCAGCRLYCSFMSTYIKTRYVMCFHSSRFS